MLNKKLYHDNSDIFQKYIALTTQKPLLVSKVLAEINKHFDLTDSTAFSFLDIGCGDGVVTLPIIEYLDNRSDLKTTCVEPSPELLDVIRSKVKTEAVLIQEDLEKIVDLPRADFVLMSHIFSYIKDSRDAIKKVYKSLNNGGVGLIVINNKESDDSKLRKSITIDYNLISEMIQTNLGELEIPFRVEVVESQIDVSGVSSMDDHGKTIISFFKHKKFEEIPKDEVESIRGGVLKLANGKGFLTKQEDYIWFYK